jgi:hypothetical protein
MGDTGHETDSSDVVNESDDTPGDSTNTSHNSTTGLYSQLRQLPVTVEDVTLEERRIETGERTFARTIFQIYGDESTGYGEEVSPHIEAHEQLRTEELSLPKGIHTIGTYTTALDKQPPLSEVEYEGDRSYLRWGIESAVLDLALKQADKTLADILNESFTPVNFVASVNFGDPPDTDSVHRLLERVPKLGLKIDVTEELSGPQLEELATTGAVRVLDLKGQYGPETGAPADPELYEWLFELFPDVLIEDPTVTDETRGILTEQADRISWDAPIRGVDDIEACPWKPSTINVKPCRFGSLETLCHVLEYAGEHDIELYGGGMFELDAGRAHSQAIASLFYPDGPNDLAPPAYHQFEGVDSLPVSPLDPPSNPRGIGWHSR